MDQVKVMIVDDCAMIREIIALLLSDDAALDCRFEAETGSDAMREIEHRMIDVVTLDLELPNADGLSLIAAIKEKRDCGVVVISGSNERHSRALEAGASACFDKSTLMYNRAAFASAVRAAATPTH